MKRIFEILEKLGISYENYEHIPTHSIEDAKGIDIPGKRVKSLLLKNKKATNFYMVVVSAEKKLDVNTIRFIFDDTKLSFVSVEKMKELIGLEPGHVSPYALINNEEKNITVALDSDLQMEKVGFHPLRNDNTIVTKMEDIEKFLGALQIKYKYVEI